MKSSHVKKLLSEVAGRGKTAHRHMCSTGGGPQRGAPKSQVTSAAIGLGTVVKYVHACTRLPGGGSTAFYQSTSTGHRSLVYMYLHMQDAPAGTFRVITYI